MTRINDTEITPKLFNEIVTRRRQGSKMFLVIPERTILDQIMTEGACCLNCDGAGNIGIQVLLSGPHDEPHVMTETLQGSEGPQKHNVGCVWYKERWFNAKTILDTCPVCQGSGKAAPKPVRAAVRESSPVYAASSPMIGAAVKEMTG